MDIRNFFTKKKGSAPAETSKAGAAASKKKPSPQKKRKEVTPAEFFGEEQPPTKRPSPSTTAARRRQSPDRHCKKSVPPSNSPEIKAKARAKEDAKPPVASNAEKTQDSSPKKKRLSPSKSPIKDKNINLFAKKKTTNGQKKETSTPIDDPPTLSLEEPKPKKKRVSGSPIPRSAPKVYAAEEITEQPSFDMNSAKPLCLEGLAFCCSGVLEELDRLEVTEMIKTLGGRVTGAVSSKTHYLILGSLLEDGRPAEQGKKYQRAVAEPKCCILRGARQLYGLIQKYSGPISANATPVVPVKTPSIIPDVSAKKAPPTMNPYAQKTSNPYAKKPSEAQKPVKTTSKAMVKSSGTNDLWVDKYKPSSSREILGNNESVKKLAIWLSTWESRFNTPEAAKMSISAPKGPWKAALLSGPPGIGKTTTAMVVASENGRDVLEFNASDVRSKKALQDQVGDITGSATLQFSKTKAKTKRCIIMDEVDGMGAGDRSGVSELIQMIKKSKVPIICICNDRQSQKLKSLIPYCMDLRYKRPQKPVIARRAIEVAACEGMEVEQNAVEAIVESCGNDIRQVLNCLQMWSSKVGDSLSYKTLKERENSIKKDEILRVSMFDATRVIVEGRRGLGATADSQTARNHFFRRNDAYFVDYNFIGLMVHENYLKVIQPQYNEVKRKNDSAKMLALMDRVHGAAESMSDWALCEERVRSAQAWSLLPVSATMVVRTGSLAGGSTGGVLPGFPQFTGYLGRMSSRSKKMRLLGELGFHLNYKIQGGRDELRMAYLPTFRSHFIKHLKSGDIANAIALMDEYGLDRNDILERFDEFQFDGVLFDKLDSKTKAALTRSYNQGAHKSQALIAEQGAGPKKQKVAAAETVTDPDAINDDAALDEDEVIDDEADAEKIRSMFKSKKRKGGKKAAATKTKPKKKR